jgi:anti-sigma-K factor RskA
VTCAEFKDGVAAYALGILEPAERAAMDRHLAEPVEHDGCRAALAAAYETGALLGAALPPAEPGPHVWAAIAREIGAGAGTGARSGLGATREPARRGGRREAIAWIAAAAAAVAAFVVGREYVMSERRLADAQRELAVASAVDRDKQICLRELATARVSLREKDAALSLLEAPGTQLIQLAAQGADSYRASALLNPGEKSGMVLTTALKPVQGKDYQLWLIRGDEKISAGILRTDPSGATLARISEQVLAGGRPDAFAVTIEPPGGMPQPTGPIILLGKVPA